MASPQEFYDNLWASSDTIKADQKLWAMRRSAIEHSYAMLGDFSGKKILEIGCGTGMQTVEFARRGGLVTAIDISLESIRQTKRMAEQAGVEIAAQVMNGEKLQFADGLFDIVYIDAVLMHADPLKVMGEAARVCKQGGQVLVLEPLRYNPFSLPYRLFFSPYQKTRPKYMTLGKFRKFGKVIPSFRGIRHQEFFFLSVLLFPFYKEGKDPRMRKAMEKIDTILFTMLPPLRSLAWIAVVEYHK